MNCEYLYGGGFYEIMKLNDEERNEILDIWILIGSISSHKDLEKLRTIYEIEAVMQANKTAHCQTPRKST
jgi:hypothetical protein